MRVLCLVPYPESGASNRLRVQQYVPVLRGVGIEMTVSSFFDETAYRVLYEQGRGVRKAFGVTVGAARRIRDALRARKFDLVLIHRESAPIGPPLIERLLAWMGIPFVFDFDDAIFLRPIHPANQRWRWLRPPSRVAESVRLATAVVVGNRYLADWAGSHHPDVTIIPTPVNTDLHRPLSRSGGDRVMIVWTGSTTTLPYLHEIDAVLKDLTTRHNVALRVIGAAYSSRDLPIEIRRWSIATEPVDVATCDIGVLPEPDDAWTRGKGAFKALVYMACGLPVVASLVGVNSDVVSDGQTGFLVRTRDEWHERLEQLITDPTLRAHLGAAGRRKAVAMYSVEQEAPLLASVLRRAAKASE